MKLTKPLIILAGLLALLPCFVRAQIYPGTLSLSGGPPSSPQLVGTTNWISYTATVGKPVSSVCEPMPSPTNTIYTWSSSYGTWVTSSNNPSHWTNVFTVAGWYTNKTTCTVECQGVDCTGTNYYDVSTNASVTNIIQVKQAYKITYSDTPSDPARPWNCEFTLQAVCVPGTNNIATNYSSSYTSLASITWGLSVDANGAVTLNKSGDGNPGDTGKIIVTSFTSATNGTSRGASINAYYVGSDCNNGQYNWVQTITTDTDPPPGETLPWPDCDPGPPTQTPYYYGWPGSVTLNGPWDLMANHVSTYP